VCRDGEWCLSATIDIAEPDVEPVGRMIGADLGQKYLAATSGGHLHGAVVAPVRARYHRLRRNLQANGSKSARRLLRRRRRRERRFVADVNHCISSKVVR